MDYPIWWHNPNDNRHNSTLPLIFFYNWPLKKEKKMSSQKRRFFPFFSSKSTNEVIKERVAQCNCDFFQVLLVDHKKWPKNAFFPILYLGSNWSTNLLHIVIRIFEMSEKNKLEYGDIIRTTIIITQLSLWSFSTIGL